MKRFLLSLALSFLPTGLAFSAPCGELTEKGQCLGLKTLEFCEHQEAVRLLCPEMEFCSYDERFGGAAGCVPMAQLPCEFLPPRGFCDGNVYYDCNRDGQIEAQLCRQNETCTSERSDGQRVLGCLANEPGQNIIDEEPDDGLSDASNGAGEDPEDDAFIDEDGDSDSGSDGGALYPGGDWGGEPDEGFSEDEADWGSPETGAGSPSDEKNQGSGPSVGPSRGDSWTGSSDEDGASGSARMDALGCGGGSTFFRGQAISLLLLFFLSSRWRLSACLAKA